MIRRKKKSESMAAILIEAGNFGSWRLVNNKVNQTERYDEFADAQAVKVFLISTARAASQRHTELGHRKSIAIFDACLYTDMYELIHAHPPEETESWCIVLQCCCSQLMLEQGEPHDCGIYEWWSESRSNEAECVPQGQALG